MTTQQKISTTRTRLIYSLSWILTGIVWALIWIITGLRISQWKFWIALLAIIGLMLLNDIRRDLE
jgi:magnesium-transporting ATPase (P-type)